MLIQHSIYDDDDIDEDNDEDENDDEDYYIFSMR